MTPPRPMSPQAFTRSLNDRATNTSKTTGRPTRELLELYYHRRLLARVFHADTEGWVLKGGQALLMRWPQARYSTDIDLVRTGDETAVNEAVAALITAATVDLDDQLHYAHHDTSAERTANRPSRKVRFKAMFGLRQLSVVSVDVVVAGSEPVGELRIEPLTAPFTVDCDPWPDVRIWPLEDHIADKIAAMYERHGDRLRPSTRFKDLIDLALIALKSTLDGPTAHTALHREVRRRQDAGTHLVLPVEFTVPDPVWAAGYGAEARGIRELPVELRTLAGATPVLDAFVTPLLGPQAPQGIWRIEQRQWA